MHKSLYDTLKRRDVGFIPASLIHIVFVFNEKYNQASKIDKSASFNINDIVLTPMAVANYLQVNENGEYASDNFCYTLDDLKDLVYISKLHNMNDIVRKTFGDERADTSDKFVICLAQAMAICNPYEDNSLMVEQLGILEPRINWNDEVDLLHRSFLKYTKKNVD